MKRAWQLGGLTFLLLTTSNVAWADMPDLSAMLNHINSQIGELSRLVAALVYMTGFFFIFTGVHKLKVFAEARNMMSSHAEMKGPLIYLLIGGLLLFWPTLVPTTLTTIYGSSSILSYSDVLPQQVGPFSEQTIQTVGHILRLIGYIAFFRGWMLMVRTAQHQVSPGTFTKAIMHIVSGICLVNLYATWQIVADFLGLMTS